MRKEAMEINIEKLKSALEKLPAYEPSESTWTGIEANLTEIPLHISITKLPEYQPTDSLWDNIEKEISKEQVISNTWWIAAAVVMVVGSLGFWMAIQPKTASISYTEQTIDSRLQVDSEQDTDRQFQKLEAYCEEEALVCESKNFKRLKAEYETLNYAAEQLKNAMGEFNTEPELVKQFNNLEREKGDILNEMAKLI